MWEHPVSFGLGKRDMIGAWLPRFVFSGASRYWPSLTLFAGLGDFSVLGREIFSTLTYLAPR